MQDICDISVFNLSQQAACSAATTKEKVQYNVIQLVLKVYRYCLFTWTSP